MLHVIEFLETTQFFKTLTITSSDDDTRVVVAQLEANDHCCTSLDTTHIDTDRPSIHARLRQFMMNETRNFCTSYQIISQHQIDVESSLMDHDMIILYSLDDDTMDMCLKWLRDARSRGFRNKHSELYHVLIVDHEKILLHNVEQQ